MTGDGPWVRYAPGGVKIKRWVDGQDTLAPDRTKAGAGEDAFAFAAREFLAGSERM